MYRKYSDWRRSYGPQSVTLACRLYRAESKQIEGVLLESNEGLSVGVGDLAVPFPEGISSSLDGSSPIVQAHER